MLAVVCRAGARRPPATHAHTHGDGAGVLTTDMEPALHAARVLQAAVAEHAALLARPKTHQLRLTAQNSSCTEITGCAKFHAPINVYPGTHTPPRFTMSQRQLAGAEGQGAAAGSVLLARAADWLMAPRHVFLQVPENVCK